MVAVPFSFSLKLSSFDSAGPRRRSHPSESPSGRVFRTLPERRRCRSPERTPWPSMLTRPPAR